MFFLARNESAELEKQVADNVAEKENIEQELAASMQLEKDKTAHIEQQQGKLDSLHNSESDISEELKTAELEAEKIMQQVGFEQQNLDRIKAERERFEAELAEIMGETCCRDYGVDVEDDIMKIGTVFID